MPDERAEEARAVMIALFPEGFEEVGVEDGVELAAYTDAGGKERLWQAFGPGRSEAIARGWSVGWRGFHRPVRVGPLWIGPPWETPDADAIPVTIDPGQAFGTGAHATTRLCLELLLDEERGSVLDIGCGSGVLAIAAAKLGFAPVVALDHDPAAVTAARAGAETNGVEVDVRPADVLADPLPAADVALANVTLDVVERVAARVDAARLIASGYLVANEPELGGWKHERRLQADGWAADLLVRG